MIQVGCGSKRQMALALLHGGNADGIVREGESEHGPISVYA